MPQMAQSAAAAKAASHESGSRSRPSCRHRSPIPDRQRYAQVDERKTGKPAHLYPCHRTVEPILPKSWPGQSHFRWCNQRKPCWPFRLFGWGLWAVFRSQVTLSLPIFSYNLLSSKSRPVLLHFARIFSKKIDCSAALSRNSSWMP